MWSYVPSTLSTLCSTNHPIVVGWSPYFIAVQVHVLKPATVYRERVIYNYP